MNSDSSQMNHFGHAVLRLAVATYTLPRVTSMQLEGVHCLRHKLHL